MSKLIKQINIINVLTEMLQEDLIGHEEYPSIYEKWVAEGRDYCNYPQEPSKAKTKRIMLIIREETIKLEKIFKERS